MKSARKSVRRDHAGETRNPTNKEKTELHRILNKIIKIILLGPTSTPPEALHIETGTMDIEHTTMKNRLNRDKTLQANPNSLTSKVKEMEQSKKNTTPTGLKTRRMETRTEYMNVLTRKQASTIFKAWTRMPNVKNNYRYNHLNTECRMCKNAMETQKHILGECP